MFNRSIAQLLTLMFVLTLAVTAQADVAFNLEPTGGGISGAPGDTIGWGYTVSNDTTYWLWVGGSVIAMDKDSSWGTYTDTSFNVDPLAPMVGGIPSVLAVPFSPAGGTGAGSFSIDPTAPFGDMARGYITFNYTLYDADPSQGGGTEMGYGSVDVNATVATPEPTTYLLLCLSLGVVGLVRRQLRQLR